MLRKNISLWLPKVAQHVYVAVGLKGDFFYLFVLFAYMLLVFRQFALAYMGQTIVLVVL